MDRPKRVMVTGSRRWAHPSILESALEHAAMTCGGQLVVVHGANRGGADAQADAHARSRGWIVERFPPKTWTREDLLGRNRAMVASNPDLVLAFVSRDSRGTWHAANAALAAGIPVQFYGDPLTEAEVDLCRRAAVVLRRGTDRSRQHQALCLALAGATVGCTRSPALVPAAMEIRAEQGPNPHTVST